MNWLKIILAILYIVFIFIFGMYFGYKLGYDVAGGMLDQCINGWGNAIELLINITGVDVNV
jgi:hypothetical protein